MFAFLHEAKLLFHMPGRVWCLGEVGYLAVDLVEPVLKGPLLHKCDHGHEVMSRAMMAELKPLDATCGSRLGDDVFALIAIIAFWCGKAFAFNGEKSIKLAVSAAFNNE